MTDEAPTALDSPGADAEHVEAAGAGDAAPQTKGFYLSPRHAFLIMAGVLSLVLVGLSIQLWWLTRTPDFTKRGGETRRGLIPVLSIYGPGRPPAERFNQPMGVAWNPDGSRLYVADSRNNRICVFDQEGRFITEFGSLGVAKPLPGAARTWDPGELSYPVDVAVGDDGRVYVADFYNDSISVFTEAGRFIRRFPDPYAPAGRGSSGADGGGIAVTAVAVHEGRVYATDTYQVFVFSSEGEYLAQFGRPGMGPDGLDHPGGLTVDRDGRVYVSDSNQNRVKAYTPDGEVLWVSGRPVSGLKDESDNAFVLPRGLSVLRDGSILVADPLGQQLLRVGSDGKVVAEYGERGAEEGLLNFPNDVAASSDLVAVADRQNQRVQVLRLNDR